MLRSAWLTGALGVALAVACGGTSDDEGLFGGGGDAGEAGASTGGTGGESGTGGAGGGGGSDPDGGVGGSAAAGGSAGASGAAGSGGPDAGPEYTLDNVCQKLPAATCALRQGCCTQSSIGFDQGECEARESEICKQLVNQVNAGERSFDPSHIEACIAGFQPLMAACKFSGEQYVSYLKATNACNAIFASKNGPGSACSQASDCAPASDPNGYSGCTDNGQCYQATLAAQGETCNERICNDGLACVYPPFVATPSCQPKTALGAACNGSAQCGFGFYCPFKVTQDICEPAQPGGSICTSGLHCLSLECNFGQCAEQPLYVDAKACGK